ncbi:MAG: hypothetical protein JWR13_1261, partial [Mycobacterium sp.]|nr:hypothetical protein [Mycobacterium sp.]
MWLVGRLIAALLAMLMTVIFTGPAAWASPEGQTTL